MTQLTTAQLIALLLPIVLQVTPGLIADVENLIRGNPQMPGETDDAYVARLNAQIDANAAKVAQEDAAVEAEDTGSVTDASSGPPSATPPTDVIPQ